MRRKVQGEPSRPRLCVFRSSKHIYAQVIDDTSGRTLCSASTLNEKADGPKTVSAKAVGAKLAENAKAQGITRVRFDRGGFAYHGRIAALADAAREGGLEF